MRAPDLPNPIDASEPLFRAISTAYDGGKLDIGRQLPGNAILQEINDQAEKSPIGSDFTILNEFLLLANYRVHYYMFSAPYRKEALLDYFFSNRMARLGSAIRVLCGKGFDVDARMLLRNLYELSLLWCKIQLDQSAREEYQASADPREANKFWHKHISKGRLRKFVETETKSKGVQWIGLINDGRNLDLIEKACGLASHPTYISKVVSGAEDFKGVSNFCFSPPSHYSKFTLKSAALCMSLPGSISFQQNPPLETLKFKEPPEYPKPKEVMTWDEYVRRFSVVEFLLSVIAYAPRKQED
ncbi:hypothetical protein [Roseomonas elaeocarpi]|uniref:Uncharacterized protein n=1 Tax=Roseomonas elaeocarpi TaxID=907779 RepID=A0ABV6JP08_9PROT